MRRGAAMRKVLCAAALALCAVCAPGAQNASASARSGAGTRAKAAARALLVQGAEAVKGLPHFGRNALPAISGEYRLLSLADSPPVLVWMTDQALYLAPADWASVRVASRPAHEARGGFASGGAAYRLVLFDRPFSALGQGADPSLWSVLIAIPEVRGADGDPEAAREFDRFVPTFLDRLSYFLSNARARTDASFPAVLDW